MLLSSQKSTMQRLLTEPEFGKKALWLTSGLVVVGVVLLVLAFAMPMDSWFYGSIGVAAAFTLLGVIFFFIALRTVRAGRQR